MLAPEPSKGEEAQGHPEEGGRGLLQRAVGGQTIEEKVAHLEEKVAQIEARIGPEPSPWHIHSAELAHHKERIRAVEEAVRDISESLRNLEKKFWFGVGALSTWLTVLQLLTRLLR